MKDKTDSSNHKFINLIEVEDRQDTMANREDFRTGLGQTTIGTIHIEKDQGMDKIIEVGEDMILIIEVVMETMMKGNQRCGRQNYNRNGFMGNFRNQSYERNRSRTYDRQTRCNSRRDNRSISNSRLRSGSRASTNRDRITCFECSRVWPFCKRLPNNISRQRGRTNSADVQYVWRSDIITNATNGCRSG